MLGLKLCFFAEFWDLQDKKCSIFCLRNLSSGLLFDELIKKTDDMKGKYDWLDLIRGVAALAVFIGHLRVICFSDVPFTHLDLERCSFDILTCPATDSAFAKDVVLDTMLESGGYGHLL